ncbi:MAG: deaminase [archaeon]|jgi:dCMP deaminase|nr:deaminase [archaeon]
MARKIRRPSWDESFMLAAALAASRSSCLHIKAGAGIVKDKRLIASGYNGAPQNIENCLERGCRKEEYRIPFETKGTGTCRGAHAEKNAMDQIAREDLKGTTIYTIRYPCSACAKEIVGNGIVEVVYARGYDEPDSLTDELFKEARVKLRHLRISEIRLKELEQSLRSVLYD